MFLVFPSVPEKEDMNTGGERDENVWKKKKEKPVKYKHSYFAY